MVASTDITTMLNSTAYEKAQQMKDRVQTDTTDSNVFLTLMLQQLQNQDPTEPTDNTEWLSQLAQYSSLEQMTQMNSGLADCMQYMAAIYTDMSANSEINQTLSMIGKEVTLKDPDAEEGKDDKITGIVTEASFEEGSGKIKIGDKYYSIANVVSIREANK